MKINWHTNKQTEKRNHPFTQLNWSESEFHSIWAWTREELAIKIGLKWAFWCFSFVTAKRRNRNAEYESSKNLSGIVHAMCVYLCFVRSVHVCSYSIFFLMFHLVFIPNILSPRFFHFFISMHFPFLFHYLPSPFIYPNTRLKYGFAHIFI